MDYDNSMMDLSIHEWLQIEQAARGCVSGTSDEWPQLVSVIEKILGKRLETRKCSSWLRGFCEAVVLMRGETGNHAGHSGIKAPRVVKQ